MSPEVNVILQEQVQTFCGWPTDTISLDCKNGPRPHTIILFLPGNPGLVQFYIPLLTKLLENVGFGYAIRGTSYAGHGFGDTIQYHDKTTYPTMTPRRRRSLSIPWTVDGQIQHKFAWLQQSILQEWTMTASSSSSSTNDRNIHDEETTHSSHVLPNLIFLSHSIGSYLVQQILLLDSTSSSSSPTRGMIAKHTKLIIHLMPFLRFDPEPYTQKLYLTTVSKLPSVSLCTLKLSSHLASMVPVSWLHLYMNHLENVYIRNLAIQLLRQPLFAIHFLKLGIHEITTLPCTYQVCRLYFLSTDWATHTQNYIH